MDQLAGKYKKPYRLEEVCQALIAHENVLERVHRAICSTFPIDSNITWFTMRKGNIHYHDGRVINIGQTKGNRFKQLFVVNQTTGKRYWIHLRQVEGVAAHVVAIMDRNQV